MTMASRAPLVERNVLPGDDRSSAMMTCGSNCRNYLNVGSADSSKHMHGTASCLPAAPHTAHQPFDLGSVIQQFQTLRRPSRGRPTGWHQLHVPASGEDVSKHRHGGPGGERNTRRNNGQQQDPRSSSSSSFCEPREDRSTSVTKAHIPVPQAARSYESSAVPDECGSSKQSVKQPCNVESSNRQNMCSSTPSDTSPLTASQPCLAPNQGQKTDPAGPPLQVRSETSTV